MGRAYGYQCPKCNKKYEVTVGRGMDYEGLYASAIKEIIDGKYGKKVKSAYEAANGNATVDPEYVVYKCPKCGKWKNQRDVTLYDNRITDSEKQIIRKYEVKCRNCSEIMEKISGKELLNLSCPKCHAVPENYGCVDLIMWD